MSVQNTLHDWIGGGWGGVHLGLCGLTIKNVNVNACYNTKMGSGVNGLYYIIANTARAECRLQMHDLEYTRYFFLQCIFFNLEYSRYFFPLLHSLLSGVLQIIFSSLLFKNIWSTPDIFITNGIHYYLEYSRYLFSHFSFLYLEHSR